MWTRFRAALFVLVVGWTLASCTTAPRDAAAPVPEPDQVVGADLKQLYMAASAAARQSPAQQRIILQMARQASNGKELLLAMRAAVGVFPDGAGTQAQSTASEVRSIVTGKMMRVGTLGQMAEYAAAYPVDPASARPYVERMFQLAGEKADPQVWVQVRSAAWHLKVGDLEQLARTRAVQPPAR